MDKFNTNWQSALTSALIDKNQSRLGILICGHGSRNRLALDEFACLAKSLQTRLPNLPSKEDLINMKSYYQHLKATQEFGEEQSITKKPILRSSGIFPVIQNQSYTSSIHFLGYWLLKRNIVEVTLVITLLTI